MSGIGPKYFIEKDKLYQWYVVEKRSYRYIMNQLGCNTARAIKRFLIQYEIPIRYGSEAVATQWIGNKERRMKTSEAAKKYFKPFWGTQSKRPEVAAKISLSKMGNKNPMWGIRGDKNPLWLGGKDSWSKGRKIEKKRKKEIIETLGGKCEQCNTKEHLTIHHDPPWRIIRSHELKYLHVLCKECHFHKPSKLR